MELHDRIGRKITTLWYVRLRGLTLQPTAMIWLGARLRTEDGSIHVGARTQIRPGVIIDAQGGRIVIGENCTFNEYSVVYGKCGVTIGANCRIATQAVIVSGNHGMAADTMIWRQPVTGGGVVIGSDVWIAAGVVVLDGARVPDGCVLAAGAVVRPGEMVRNGIYAGVPARLVGMRKSEIDSAAFEQTVRS